MVNNGYYSSSSPETHELWSVDFQVLCANPQKDANTQKYLRKVPPDNPLLEVHFSLERLANLSLEVSCRRPGRVDKNAWLRDC